MIRTGVKLQLLAFALITVLGIGYTSVHYLGFGQGLLHSTYRVYVDLADSGGIFSNAEVTYRGVQVGRVGPLRLTANGVRVELDLTRGREIPADTLAVVADRSAVGEQYVDLQPRTNSGPYLHDGSVIPQRDTRIPVSTATLLGDLDGLARSVPTKDLSVVLTELDKAFSGMGPDLQRLIDATDQLVQTADEVYPQTAGLIDNGKTVLDTQRASAGAIAAFARGLNQLSTEIRRDDPSIRGTIDNGVPAAQQTTDLVDRLSPTLPVLLGNLTTVGQVTTARLPGLRQVLVTYPLGVAGAFTTAPGDGTSHFGFELNVNAPPPCTRGYEKTPVRYPQDESDTPAPTDSFCKEPKNSSIDVRGSRNAPAPGPTPWVPPNSGPPGAQDTTSGDGSSAASASSASGGSGAPGDAGASMIGAPSWQQVYLAGYDPQTRVVYAPGGQRFILGSTGGQQRLLGDRSWQWLLLEPLG